MHQSERQKNLLREWIELAEYPSDCRRQYFEGYGHRTLLAERYRRGEGTCHLHVSFEEPLGHGHFRDWCAEYYPGVLDGETLERWKVRRLHEIEYHVKGRVEIDWGEHHWYQQPVLVRVGELAQRPEQWAVVQLVSTVWLKPLDDCVVSRINVHKRSANGARPALGVIKNRKLDPSRSPGVGSDSPCRIVQSQLPHEMIERRAKILDGVPGNESDLLQDVPEVRNATDVDNVFAGIRIELDPNSYAILFESERPLKIGLKRCVVFLRTSDFGPTP